MSECFRVRVECYAGYRGEEAPRRFTLGEKSTEVEEVLGRWLAPDHRYFKVRDPEGATYILRQDVEFQSWELILYEYE